MHECPECGLYCDCDGEDMHQPAPIHCTCDHEGSGMDAEYEDFDDLDVCHHGVGFDEEYEDCEDEIAAEEAEEAR